MSKYSFLLEPTKENAIDSLKKNSLNNNDWISKCLKILLNMDDSIVSFNAKWGDGKTFLAKQMVSIINEIWKLQAGEIQDTDMSDIRNLDFDNLPKTSSFAIYYNAWEFDNENNPVVSFLYFLLRELGKNIKTSKFKQVATSFFNNLVSKISYDLIDLSSTPIEEQLEKVLDTVIDTEFIRAKIGEFINELRSEKCNKLIVFIDELDRCRPIYALKVIEMIKHYLKMENVLVVCMTDIEQLAHCIQNVYGLNYDAYMYLDKIFDFKFNIPSNNYNIKEYIRRKSNLPFADNWFFDLTLLEVIKEFNLSLRNIDKLLSYSKFMILNKKEIESDFPVKAFVDYLFLPYYLAVRLFNDKLYNNFKNGQLEHYMNFCNRTSILKRIKKVYSPILGESYDEAKINDYLEHDCRLLIQVLNGQEYLEERFYVEKNAFRLDIKQLIKRLDLLNFFIEGTK